jgi:4-hydroxy-3-methylbut-2-enyl diphosphate reductase
VKQVATDADLLLVVGSENSSNSNRLVEVARNLGTNAHLIDSYKNIKPEWLQDVSTISLTAGASAPECLVEEVVKFLGTKGFDNVQELEVMPENVRFGLPPEIVEAIASAPAAISAD